MMRRAVLALLAVFGTAGTAWANCEDLGSVEIYPTSPELPENLLRIYVYFPTPMAPDTKPDLVRLLHSDGAPVAGVFLNTRQELWSPDHRRLTLLLDPGRVKTGLDAHDALGRALVAGEAYSFEVSAGARTADGCVLEQSIRHEFTATPADMTPPQPALWDLAPPKVSTHEPLIVKLGSSHDHLSLAFRLRVLDAKGDVVPGAVALGDGEDSWQFTPRAPWASSPYSLAIDERLEDLAGNRPGALFDRPLNKAPLPWAKSLDFTPRP